MEEKRYQSSYVTAMLLGAAERHRRGPPLPTPAGGAGLGELGRFASPGQGGGGQPFPFLEVGTSALFGTSVLRVVGTVLRNER